MRPDNTLTLAYLEKHPHEAARVLEGLPYSMSAQLLEQLSPDCYLATLQFLTPSYAANLLDAVQEENKGKLVNAFSSEKLSTLLTFYEEEKRNRFLNHLSTKDRVQVIRHMQYPLGTVGTIMSPPAYSLPSDITVAEALKRIKNSKKKYPAEVFIVDRSDHYLGSITLDRLIKEAANTRLSSITDSSRPSLSTRKLVDTILDNSAWVTSRILPVTDSRGVLAGFLAYDALLRHRETDTHQEQPYIKNKQSVLELFFQTLAILIEGLATKIFPFSPTKKSRDTSHDNTA